MSIKLLSQVWEHETTGNERAVLQVLCDRAGDEGICWPKQLEIAWKVGISDRHVRNILVDLKSQGVLEVIEQGGRGPRDTTRVRINLDALPIKQSPPWDEGGKGGNTKVEKVEVSKNKVETAVADFVIEPPFLEPPLRKKETPKGVEKNPPKIQNVPLPDDFKPTDERIKYALSKGLSKEIAELEFESFVDYYRKPGAKQHTDYDAAWRTWVRNEAKWKGERQAQQTSKVTHQVKHPWMIGRSA